MDTRMVIDGMVRLVERGDNLPFNPSWPQLKQEMAQSEIFSLEDLEPWQEYSMTKYYHLRIERMQQDMAKHLGRPAGPKTASSKDAAPSEGSSKDSGFNGSCKGSESDEEGNFQPTLDETATVSRTRSSGPLSAARCLTLSFRPKDQAYCPYIYMAIGRAPLLNTVARKRALLASGGLKDTT